MYCYCIAYVLRLEILCIFFAIWTGIFGICSFCLNAGRIWASTPQITDYADFTDCADF